VRTAGVDLAAEPRGTALAVIEWSESEARLVQLDMGVTDAPIVKAALSVDKIGIDCALGWPQDFAAFMAAHANISDPATHVDGGMEWRRRLAYRETDRVVREQTGRWPLSVSTDRLGLTAMRCAGLLSRMNSAELDVDRSGAGRVVEVYPGASLRRWGLDTTGYRVSSDARTRLVAQLRDQAPWLSLDAFVDAMINSADALDAVIAALSARASALGMCPPPPAEHAQLARVEGWIALPPPGSLSELRSARDAATPDAE
jgi:predicted nuclease with RNAse H fold